MKALECLIRNAAEAMPDGGRLVVKASNQDWTSDGPPGDERVPPGRYVLVEVADAGAGMTRQVAERAFEPFFTSKGLAEHTGLGLSFVHGCVRQSGGHVTLDSREGRGTTVRLYLPVADDDSGQT
jgi:signal transduction histidine kinase